jgi:hypothetical protein
MSPLGPFALSGSALGPAKVLPSIGIQTFMSLEPRQGSYRAVHSVMGGTGSQEAQESLQLLTIYFHSETAHKLNSQGNPRVQGTFCHAASVCTSYFSIFPELAR